MKHLNVASLVVIIATYVALFMNAASHPLPYFPGFSMLDVVYLAFVIVFILQAKYTPNVLDLEEQFSFYSSYHDHFINKLIHLFMIWPLVWSTSVLFSGTTPIPIPPLAAYLPKGLPWGPTAMSAGFATYVYFLDRKSGPLTAALSFLCLFTAQLFCAAKGDQAFAIAVLVHVVGWVSQFIGHGIFERRAPSLLNNLAQSFLMAPHFVFLEALFMLGYRRDLYERTRPRVAQRIKALNDGKAQ